MSNVLIIGSGGREHALGWKLKQSPKVNNIYFAPGNGGTHKNISTGLDIDKLIEFATHNHCFTVVGTEIPLDKGIVDKFYEKNLKIFGPTRAASKLETSKAWSKVFMKKNKIPTPSFEIFDECKLAIEYVKSSEHPIVIKTDGLAAGKGAFVCSDINESTSVINNILLKNVFGSAGNKIIIEEYIRGNEISYIVLADGNSIIPMATSKDYKRIYDENKGPNTGGMGSYSPVKLTNVIEEKIKKKIIQKTVYTMKHRQTPFIGFLYAGIIIKNSEPYVLEFNVRMGDPECQSIIARLDSDLYDYLIASTDGILSSMPLPMWKKKSAVCVILSSSGYPNKYIKNELISGLDYKINDTLVFHNGTKIIKNKIFTNGGRVLSVVALGDTIESASNKAYYMANKIKWKNRYYRKDIGKNVDL